MSMWGRGRYQEWVLRGRNEKTVRLAALVKVSREDLLHLSPHKVISDWLQLQQPEQELGEREGGG